MDRNLNFGRTSIVPFCLAHKNFNYGMSSAAHKISQTLLCPQFGYW
jgi:hypothetical protein